MQRLRWDTMRTLSACTILCLLIASIGPAFAYACEGGGEESSWGILSFTSGEIPLQIPVGTTNNYTVLYDEIGGPSGVLKPEVVSGPFTIPGGSCKGANLKDEETCVVQIKCTGAKGALGSVKVHSPEPKVKDAARSTECV
jgi:hypothetical protein